MPDLEWPTVRNCEKYISLVYGIFVTAAYLDDDSKVPSYLTAVQRHAGEPRRGRPMRAGEISLPYCNYNIPYYHLL